MGYIGTRFINTQEAAAPDAFKQMILESGSTDIIYTDAISGVHGNFLKPSIEQAGLDPANLPPGGGQYRAGHERNDGSDERKAWKNIWSAGQGVANISDTPSIADLVARFDAEYQMAHSGT
jgi:nitronate monooxygenase